MKIKIYLVALSLIGVSMLVSPFITNAATTAQIQTQIDSTKKDIASTTAQISSFRTQISSINSQILALQNQLSSADVSVATLQQNLISLNLQLQTLNKQLASSTVATSTIVLATTSPYIYSVDTESNPGNHSFKIGNLYIPNSKVNSWSLYIDSVLIKQINAASTTEILTVPNYILCNNYEIGQVAKVQARALYTGKTTNQFPLTISLPCSLSLLSLSVDETWVPFTTTTSNPNLKVYIKTKTTVVTKDIVWTSNNLSSTDSVSIGLVPFGWVGTSILGSVTAGSNLGGGKASVTWDIVGQAVQYDKPYKIVITDTNNPKFNATSTGVVKISTKVSQLSNFGLFASIWQGVNNLLSGIFGK